MFNVSRSTGLYAFLFCSCLLLTSQAHAFDLNGAWATSADQCSKVFVKTGDKISFAHFSEEFGGGFVADGNDVRSKTARRALTTKTKFLKKQTIKSALLTFPKSSAAALWQMEMTSEAKLRDAPSC